MDNITDSLLETIAGYSNTVSVIIILTCFACMMVFILRLNLDQVGSRIDFTPGDDIPAQAMRGVHQPFVFQVHPDRPSSLHDGAWMELTGDAPCVVQALWGVSIKELYPAIYLPWQQFRHQFNNDTWLEQHVAVRGRKWKFDVCQRKPVHVKLPPEVTLDLGSVPRSQYPLVVVLMIDLDMEPPRETCVVSSVTILHLMDQHCPGPSKIICQYIRTTHGPPCNLQQLYMASTEESPAVQPDMPSDLTPPRPAPQRPLPEDFLTGDLGSGCVICQTEAINRVLLPCRHACVCDGCFRRLDKCPMCRGNIHSYFQLDQLDEDDWYDDDEIEEDIINHAPWWERWNHKINRLFGFV